MNAMLLLQPELAEIDRHFGEFIAGFGGGDLPAIAAAMVSRNLRDGHICLELDRGPAHGESQPGFAWPPRRVWEKEFAKNRAIGSPEDCRPLVLDKAGRLYLRRYWEYEQALAQAILRRCDRQATVGPHTSTPERAIQTALARRFVVISGGPGTGKTTTVFKIVQRLLSEPGGENLQIALTAPTGKAAARLQETFLGHAGDGMRLPTSASTLHRLLGTRPNSVYFRHDAKNPLPLDLVIVDEASMVALPLMAKLFAALPDRARVILIGDRDQLSSVEAGAVFGDIAKAAMGAGPLQGSLVVLEKNFRFGNESNIFALCNAVRQGEAGQALKLLNATHLSDLKSESTPPPPQIAERLRQQVIAGYSAYLRSPTPADALREFKRFRVLCALRTGPYGVEGLNRTIEQILREERLIRGPQHTYPGKPLLVTQNNHPLALYNGDTGILLPDKTSGADGSLRAWFIGEHGELRGVPPARLPKHEPAFAMTVHKSQGSEFENVLLILPDKDLPILTRELVYTGLTRVRTRLELWFQESVLRPVLERQVERASGLRDRLS